jgi:hypothetical protein
MQFRAVHFPKSATCDQVSASLGVTVTISGIPLATATYGTRVARSARTTMLPPEADSQLVPGVRLVLGNDRLVGKSPEARGSRVEDPTSVGLSPSLRSSGCGAKDPLNRGQ